MAEIFDPAWEYFTPDPEIAELFRNSGHLSDPLDAIKDVAVGGVWTADGYRFGRGNPNYAKFRLAPEKIKEEREPLKPKQCPTCEEFFTPDRKERVYCCDACCVRGGSERRLPESLICAACGEDFRPNHGTDRFCSRSCGAKAVRKTADTIAPPGSMTCPMCMGEVKPSTANNKKTIVRVYCSKGCKQRALRRRYNCKQAGMPVLTLEEAQEMLLRGVEYGIVFPRIDPSDGPALAEWFCKTPGLPLKGLR